MGLQKVLVVGGATFDALIHLSVLPGPLPQTIHSCGFHETVGSTGAGKALNLSRLGLETTLHALIGADDYGERIRAALQVPNLHFRYDIDPQGTERHINLMDGAGRRISIFATRSSEEPRLDLAKFQPLIQESDLVVLNIIGYTKRLIPLCRQYAKPVWTDLHDWDGRDPFHQAYLDAAAYIFMSSDNLPDYRAVMAELIGRGKRLVVCTHGREGATAATAAGEWLEIPIIPAYRMVDANGAGDSFMAGFIYGHLRGYALKKCLGLATLCAGLCITVSELAYPGLSPALLEAAYREHYGAES
jgi:sugar/nucleoside kinase (ribokinase family)